MLAWHFQAQSLTAVDFIKQQIYLMLPLVHLLHTLCCGVLFKRQVVVAAAPAELLLANLTLPFDTTFAITKGAFGMGHDDE